MSENHSQHEANKAVRVLSGKPLKLTCRVHFPDGRIIEFQSDLPPKIDYSTETRSVWVYQRVGDYSSSPLMEWKDGSIILVEENPK